jgi:hypothetical protein
MEQGENACIMECPDYVRVDFRGCTARELGEVYRSFAVLCVKKQVSRALLKSGDDDPDGHYNLHDALLAIARVAAIPYDFKVALVPSTPPIEAVYRDAQNVLRSFGLNACVFGAENEAVEWLEDHAAIAQTTS